MIKTGLLPLLFLTGFVAGFVDSIAGGGGLITVPVLLSLGIDPSDALGTNKLQATFGSSSAAWHYWRAGTVQISDCVRGFLITFAGALTGATLVLSLSNHFLLRMIPLLLIGVAVYSLLRPNLGETDLHPRMKRIWFDLVFGIVIGFYDGFLGPGTGTFWAVAFVLCLGFNLTKATGYTKVMNFGSNLAALLLFLCRGHVLWAPGLTMGAGQWVGARAGSHMVVTRGTKFIRPIFITAVLAITLKLVYDNYFKR